MSDTNIVTSTIHKRRYSSRIGWFVVVVVSLVLAFAIPMFFRQANGVPSPNLQRNAISGWLLVSIAAVAVARHTKLSWIVMGTFMAIWLIGVVTGGYKPPARNPALLPSGEPILSRPWFPIQWFPQQTSSPFLWSVLHALGFWLLSSAIVAWTCEALWLHLRRKRS
jgi:hypothetical protein